MDARRLRFVVSSSRAKATFATLPSDAKFHAHGLDVNLHRLPMRVDGAQGRIVLF